MTLREWLNRVWGTFRRTRTDRDLEDELQVHLELAGDEERRRGDLEGGAVRAARLRVGAVPQAMEAQRDQRSLTWLEDLARDLRFACRTLRKAPGFTAAAVVTLALGIGVNTAIFSIVNGVLLNPLPYSGPDQLVALYSRTADQRRDNSSYPNFLDWVRGNRSFSDLAAFREDGLNLIGLGQPERVPAEMVSASFFRLLGVQPILGRPFLATDDLLGAAPVVLISENFWKRKFDSSTSRSVRR